VRIVSHPLDEFGIVQSKQNCTNPIHDLLHEFPHLIITDARQPIPWYLAIRRHDLCIAKVADLRVRRDTGVNILDACVSSMHVLRTHKTAMPSANCFAISGSI